MRLLYLGLLATVILAAGNQAGQAVAINWAPGLTAHVIPTLIGPYNAGYVFAGITGDVTIWVYDPVTGAFSVYHYDESIADWDPVEPIFYAGEGYFVYTLLSQSFNPLFAFGGEGGVAAQGPPPLLPQKYAFQGSPTGLSAIYEDIFGVAPNDETALLRFIPGSSSIALGSINYRFYYYKNGVWNPETPVLNPLEPAFVIYPYLSIKYTISGHPPKVDMTWPSRGTLEESDSPFGTWNGVTGTVGNTYSITVDPGQNPGKFYRVRE